MRQVLRLIGTRYGVATVLCVLVILVIGVYRGVAGSEHNEPAAPLIPTSERPSADPSAGDDGDVDDVAGTPTAAVPSTSTGAAAPSTVAMNFATAWLHHTGVTADAWLSGLTPYATPALVGKLKHANPAGVPADRVTGAIQLNVRDPALAEATIPMDSGTLQLRLLGEQGRWHVDAVDWIRPT